MKIAVIYTCTIKELAVRGKVREKFTLVSSDQEFADGIDRGLEDSERREIGFLRDIGALRISVKEHWHQIIQTVKDLSTRSKHVYVPMVPIVAVSNKRLFGVFRARDKEYKSIGRVIVSIYPLYTIAIRFVFSIDEGIDEDMLIQMLHEKIRVGYKGEKYEDILNFAAKIKGDVIASLFNKEVAHKVKVRLSRRNTVIHLKGDTLVKDIKPLLGVLLLKEQYKSLSDGYVQRFLRYMPKMYEGDIILSSEFGFVAYTPFLYKAGTKLQRKRFRRKLIYAAEIGYVVKSFLSNASDLLMFVIKEDPSCISDVITRLFTIASPHMLGRYKTSIGLLKPNSLQRLFKSIAFRLELFRLYYGTLNAVKNILKNIVLPDIGLCYDRIKTLQIPIVVDIINKLYYEAENREIPRLLNALEDVVPEIYKDKVSRVLYFLLEFFKDDFVKWGGLENVKQLGWRRIEAVATKSKINKDIFYKHKGRGLIGLIRLLELYKYIEVREVPSRGRGGKVKEIRISPKHPHIKYLLLQSLGVEI